MLHIKSVQHPLLAVLKPPKREVHSKTAQQQKDNGAGENSISFGGGRHSGPVCVRIF